MPVNLALATPIPSQTVVPGESFDVQIHAHYEQGSNFNWTGYAPVGKITVGSVTITGTGTVLNHAGGTAEIVWTATQTATLPTASWGTIVVYADPTVGSANLHIASIFIRTTAEVIP
jgi:hypothetical protein